MNYYMFHFHTDDYMHCSNKSKRNYAIYTFTPINENKTIIIGMVNHCAMCGLFAFACLTVYVQWNKFSRLEEAKYPVTRMRVSGNKIWGHHIVTCILKLINKIETKRRKKKFSIETDCVNIFGVKLSSLSLLTRSAFMFWCEWKNVSFWYGKMKLYAEFRSKNAFNGNFSVIIFQVFGASAENEPSGGINKTIITRTKKHHVLWLKNQLCIKSFSKIN